MKTIAYSEVPQTHSYVHLAYLSASPGPDAAVLPAVFLGAVACLMVYLVGAAAKLDVRFPRFWRLTTIAVVAAAGSVLLFGVVLRLLQAGG